MTANTTESKFGDPQTRIAQTDYWTVLLRPKQPTLGALVLVCREPVLSFAELSAAAYADLREVIGRIEAVLKARIGYARINYLMLMMVDPDVHFHVIPRYAEPRIHAGTEYRDAGWPGPPALDVAVTPEPAAREALVAELRAAWSQLAN